jgi:hypothetical protein
MQRDLRSKAREMKRESLQQQRDLQSRESAHNLNKKLASISRETLMDDVFRLTTERNEAMVTAYARLAVDKMKASELALSDTYCYNHRKEQRTRKCV